MAEASGYVTIDEVVKSYIADQGETTLHNYVYYLHFALQALREFLMGHGIAVKTDTLTLAAVKTAAYPTDMVKWNRIGVKVGDRIQVFNQDEGILLNVGASANSSYVSQAMNGSSITLSATFYGYDYNGQGYFRDDPDNKRFLFSSEVNDTIYIEYVTNGIVAGSQSEIPSVAYELVKRYIDWKVSRAQLGDAAVETAMKKKEWINERHVVQKRTKGLSYKSVLDVLISKQVGELGDRSYVRGQGVFDFTY